MRTLTPKNHYEVMQLARDIEAEFRVFWGEDDTGAYVNREKEMGHRLSNPTRLTQTSFSSGPKHSSAIGSSSNQAQSWLDGKKETNPIRNLLPNSNSHSSSSIHRPATHFAPATASSSSFASAKKFEGGRHSQSLEKNRGLRHLTYSEIMDRKARGQCFRCGEKYHPLHRCTERQF